MKKAVFILLGQSNATGHGIPMAPEDRIETPLKNVFGLHRDHNQSFETQKLTWSGYTSEGMNLAETQDHTYSVANCLAGKWQKAIDGGKTLPDLYIVQIAIGAQGVREGYMWHPDRVHLPAAAIHSSEWSRHQVPDGYQNPHDYYECGSDRYTARTF